MSLNPRDVLRATRPGGPTGSGPVKVLVALRCAAADDDVRRRLEGLGMKIDAAVRNKVVGSVPATALDALRADPDVAEVEVSTALRPHAP